MKTGPAVTIAALSVSLAGALAAVALGLGGVDLGATITPVNPSDGWYASDLTLPDGTTVTCVAAQVGGVSCDWAGRSQR